MHDVGDMESESKTEDEVEEYDKLRDRIQLLSKKMPFDFEHLPDYLRRYILNFLSPKDSGIVSSVSRSMHDKAESDLIWKKKVYSNPEMRKKIEKRVAFWKAFHGSNFTTTLDHLMKSLTSI